MKTIPTRASSRGELYYTCLVERLDLNLNIMPLGYMSSFMLNYTTHTCVGCMYCNEWTIIARLNDSIELFSLESVSFKNTMLNMRFTDLIQLRVLVSFPLRESLKVESYTEQN